MCSLTKRGRNLQGPASTWSLYEAANGNVTPRTTLRQDLRAKHALMFARRIWASVSVRLHRKEPSMCVAVSLKSRGQPREGEADTYGRYAFVPTSGDRCRHGCAGGSLTGGRLVQCSCWHQTDHQSAAVAGGLLLLRQERL